jgi:glutamate carboxypeptidase
VGHVAEQLAGYVDRKRDEMLALLEELVSIDSGTYDKQGVDRVGSIVGEGLAVLGLGLERVAQAELGDHLFARKAGNGTPLLLIGHTDTVFATGATSQRPFAIEGGQVLGPGVIDMKGGLVVLLFGLRALREVDSPAWTDLPYVVALNSDEEILSPTSRALIEAEARQARAAVVFEPGRPEGEFVTYRKGVGKYRLTVRGRAAHAGSQPEHGISATEELAHKILAIHQLSTPEHGTTVNVGVIGGGERANVVAAEAWAEIDLRAFEPAEADRVEAALAEIAARSELPGAESLVEGGLLFPPWPQGEANRRLFELVQRAAAELGLSARETYNGAGSDGNHAALHTPVIDGMGPYGSEEHSLREYMVLEGLFERTKVFSLFLHRLAGG